MYSSSSPYLTTLLIHSPSQSCSLILYFNESSLYSFSTSHIYDSSPSVHPTIQASVSNLITSLHNFPRTTVPCVGALFVKQLCTLGLSCVVFDLSSTNLICLTASYFVQRLCDVNVLVCSLQLTQKQFNVNVRSSSNDSILVGGQPLPLTCACSTHPLTEPPPPTPPLPLLFTE